MSYIKFNFLVRKLTAVNILFISFFSLAEDSSKIIINNEAQSESTNQNVITAPELIPSQSDQMRTLRQKQEINTEDSILKELEKQRILDERKRFHSIFNKKEETVTVPSTPPVNSTQPYWFGEKPFLSVGAGLMNYYNSLNVNSTEAPTFLGSFGTYGYKGHLIFDVAFFYSVHYLKTPLRIDKIEKINEPGLAMAVKWSFLKGKMKPYMGGYRRFDSKKMEFCG